MSNRVLRFINNTSHNEPLDTNQKGDILRTGDDEYSVRIDKSYHVLTDNVKTIETDEYLKAEKTDNNVHLSIDEQQFIELIKNNCCDETDVEVPKYEKQVLNDDNTGFQKFLTNGNEFTYNEIIQKSVIDSSEYVYVRDLNEINNVHDKHDDGNSEHRALVYLSSGRVEYIDFKITLDNSGLRLIINSNFFDRLNLENNESVMIQYTGILDFVQPSIV